MNAPGSTFLWVAYVAAVGLLAALAAYVVEPVTRALRWPTRWLWTIALVAQLGAVLVALQAPGAARPAAWFAGLWIAGTAVAIVAYLRAVRVLRRERGDWRVTIAEDMPVWVSRETGPAVVGFLRSIVVAPAWAMALAERERRMLLRHEAEHVAAWDPTLLLLGLATCATVPWSPAAWWALARLRLAIEVDCDRRVLAAEPDVAAYGELLVAVQGRVVPGAAGLAAFAERRLPLEERIEAMTARRPRGAAWRWSARGAIAGALVLAACMAPRPMTTTVSGLVDIRADHLNVKRNADGTQTITAKNATITTKPDTDGISRGAMALLQDSALYTTLVRQLDSVRQDGTVERLLRQLGEVDPQRASKLASGAVQRYLVLPSTKPVARDEVAFLLLDEGGDVVRDVREKRRRAAPDGKLALNDTEFALRFRDMAGRSVPTSGSVMIGDSVLALWWLLESDQVLSERAMTRAVERAFGSAGPPQHAVGMVAALDEKWNVLDARPVPLESLPPSLPLREGDRARLLPVLATHPAWTRGSMSSSGRFVGLAARSQVFYWRRTTPDPARDARNPALVDSTGVLETTTEIPASALNHDEAAARAKALRIALDTARAYAAQHDLARGTTALVIEVLLNPDWSVRGVTHSASSPEAPILPADSVVAAFPGVKDPTVLRDGAIRQPLPFALPAGSQVVWAQLSPPRVIRVEPKEP